MGLEKSTDIYKARLFSPHQWLPHRMPDNFPLQDNRHMHAQKCSRPIAQYPDKGKSLDISIREPRFPEQNRSLIQFQTGFCFLWNKRVKNYPKNGSWSS